MFPHTGESLYKLVTSNNYDNDYKSKVITELKAHIKRDFVELSEVPKYFESLKVVNKSTDFKLSALGFSSICHLVKRVGMQDPNALRSSSKVVLPILINRTIDSKPTFRSQAKSSIETFWLATPSIVETYIKDNALIHSNPRIRSEAIIVISDIIELNRSFNFSAFLPSLVNLLRDDSIEVTKNVEVLFLKYYTMYKSKVSDLVKELQNQRIEQRLAVKIIRELDPILANSYTIETNSNSSFSSQRPTIDTFSNLTKHKKATSSSTNPLNGRVISSSSSTLKELNELLSSIKSAQLDDSIPPITVDTASDLNREIDNLLTPFNGRETEFNWNNREKNIIKFRSLVIGNAEAHQDELVQGVRVLSDGISKSITSLRTTLSSNGCQLVKELASYLHKSLDPIAESLFIPLASLTSATKRISSLNAFGAIAVLLVNTGFNNRLFNQCFSLFQDKNFQPRVYSATFLQIFILKHGSKLDQFHLETIKKWLMKGVADQNTTVRESMRSTFWTLHAKFPNLSADIYPKLDTNVKKALDRTKPKDISPVVAPGSSNTQSKTGITNEKKRQSIRDFVASKRSDRRSTSGPPTTTSAPTPASTTTANTAHFINNSEDIESNNSISELGRPNRIGVPQRMRVSSAGNPQLLPRQPSKGSLKKEVERQRWPSLGISSSAADVFKSKNQATIVDDRLLPQEDYIRITSLLKSPLTKDRIEGLAILESFLQTDMNMPPMTSSLYNLIYLDSSLLRPLLNSPQFLKLVDPELIIKVLAINKINIGLLIETVGTTSVIKGITSLIRSLDHLQFDNAPATMFHIKYKTLFLNHSIENLYQIYSSDKVDSKNDDTFRDVTSAVFPLSISDYSKYDELIVQLFKLNESVFQQVLDTSSTYVKSKIKSIIEEFNDDLQDKAIVDFTEHGLNEITMINPLKKSVNDPTTSIKDGFRSDMTRIIPNFKTTTNKAVKQEFNETNEIDDFQQLDKVDYMSDIFSNVASREQTKELEIKQEEVERDHDNDVVIPADDNENEVVDYDQNASQQPRGIEVRSTSVEVEDEREDSPFIETLVENNHGDEDDDDGLEIEHTEIPTDEATRNLTNKIGEIHISPQKSFSKPPDRKSLTELINKSDPFFNKVNKEIKIFEDKPSLVNDIKLFDFEISRFNKVEDSSKTVTIESILKLMGNFQNDEVSAKEINSLIKSLHFAINDEEISSWIKESGFRTIMESMIHYFNVSVNITKQLCFKGLIVFKELIIINEYLDNVMTVSNALSIWNILLMIVENLKDFQNDLYISVDELVDDLLDLNLVTNKAEILKSSCSSLQESNGGLLTTFLLLTLTKCIERESLSFEQIKEIDGIVYKFLSNDEVEIRRLTILTYSKCKGKLQHVNGHSKRDTGHNIADDVYKDVFGKLSIPQKKLVDYYCDI